MRGKAINAVSAVIPSRITPAYAGKSMGKPAPWHFCRDHPRICGEKQNAPHRKEVLMGSPPHMRGKVWCAEFRRISEGITPAYAGKRRSVLVLLQADRDHPRICGEKLEAVFPRFDHLGSPPHMRGKVPSSAEGEGQGKDHPRICGEKRSGAEQRDAGQGITPAYAGKSRSRFFRCVVQ